MPRPCVSSTCVLSTASPKMAAPLTSRPARFRPVERAMDDVDVACACESVPPPTDPTLVESLPSKDIV